MKHTRAYPQSMKDVQVGFLMASVATDAEQHEQIFRGGLSKSAYLLNAVPSVQGVGNGCVREAGASSGIDRVKEWSSGNCRSLAALCTTGNIFFAKTQDDHRMIAGYRFPKCRIRHAHSCARRLSNVTLSPE